MLQTVTVTMIQTSKMDYFYISQLNRISHVIAVKNAKRQYSLGMTLTGTHSVTYSRKSSDHKQHVQQVQCCGGGNRVFLPEPTGPCRRSQIMRCFCFMYAETASARWPISPSAYAE